MKERPLIYYVVYENPSDFPGKFVVRKQWGNSLGEIEKDINPLMVEDEYRPIRNSMMRRGLYRMDRHIGDDPVIKETWI